MRTAHERLAQQFLNIVALANSHTLVNFHHSSSVIPTGLPLDPHANPCTLLKATGVLLRRDAGSRVSSASGATQHSGQRALKFDRGAGPLACFAAGLATRCSFP